MHTLLRRLLKHWCGHHWLSQKNCRVDHLNLLLLRQKNGAVLLLNLRCLEKVTLTSFGCCSLLNTVKYFNASLRTTELHLIYNFWDVFDFLTHTIGGYVLDLLTCENEFPYISLKLQFHLLVNLVLHSFDHILEVQIEALPNPVTVPKKLDELTFFGHDHREALTLDNE